MLQQMFNTLVLQWLNKYGATFHAGIYEFKFRRCDICSLALIRSFFKVGKVSFKNI